MGTLDPFASGILLVAVGGATRINDYVHRFLPKTYLAVGKLGVWTETGDLTVPIQQHDESEYLASKIASFSPDFIQEQLQNSFTGEYLQAPPIYSAAKFQGKPLHQWKREDGIEIKKEPVSRTIHSIEVVRYSFPFISLRVTVSSGTYIRTLFEDVANCLGTIGSLSALLRAEIGGLRVSNALHSGRWPIRGEEYQPPFYQQFGHRVDQLLPLNKLVLQNSEMVKFRNGNPVIPSADLMVIDSNLDQQQVAGLAWVYSDSQGLQQENCGPIGLGEVESGQKSLRPLINFA
mgnify:FL=1